MNNLRELEDDQMEQIKSITADIENGPASKRIEKIIFDIIFQHVKDMVFIMKVEAGPRFRYFSIDLEANRRGHSWII
jgi:hypothetical protein